MPNEYYEWNCADNGKSFELSFESARSGNLNCLECGELWCKHIQLAMVKNLDHEFVWEHIPNQIAIPMFPTSKIWCQALIEPVENASYAKLYYVEMEPPAQEIMVSYLHPGEGRNVIRTVFVDYMLTQRVVQDKMICSSPSHKFRQEQVWQRRTDYRSKNRVAEYWSVWTTGSCTECRGVNPADFDSDLVPNDEKKSIW